MHRLAAAALITLAACTEPATDPPPPFAPTLWIPPLSPFHVVTVNADGTFSPMWTTAADGDFVVWTLSDRTDSIIPSAWSGAYPAICDTPAPWDPAALNHAVTGPNPVAAAGVFTLSPFGSGLVSQASVCPRVGGRSTEVAAAAGLHLCRTGVEGATMESTWADPDVDGVILRLRWSQLEPADCTSANLTTCWDWTIVDREIQAAVDHGKLYSLTIKAGDDGTPDWLFTTDPPANPFVNPIGATRAYPTGGVTRLFLQDSGNDTPGCGQPMYLGDPTDAVSYQPQYFDMLTALAAHIKTRSDWYRALAYVKPSGANLQSAENRLPKRCDTSAGCVCNTAVLAADGYTPAGLFQFYDDQIALLAALFPGKTISYALIQQGFPRITDAATFQIDDDAAGNPQSSSGNVADLPLPAAQTDTILAHGAAAAAALGFVWSVQHNGLGPTLAPNQTVLDAAAADATTVTGFQTNAADKVPDGVTLDDTFANLETNAPEGSFLEIYEERQWEVAQLGGVLDPAGSNRTLGGWGDLLRDRRRATFPALADPEPAFHVARVHSNLAQGSVIVHYVNARVCGRPGALYGALTITP